MIGNLMILGDSYSTFTGHIPEGYVTYYTAPDGYCVGHVSRMQLEETWWQRFIKATGADLVLNNSWSGSTICYTGYEGDCSTTSSFIYRYRQLKAEGFFEKNRLDTLIVFGGTNDSWVPSPLGEVKLEGVEESDLVCARPAICYLMGCLKRDLPDTRIVFIANCDISEEIVDCIKLAAEHFGVEVVELHGIDKQDSHPTPLGMEQICEQVVLGLGEG